MKKERIKIDLLSVCVNSFDRLLQSAMLDDRAWKQTAEGIGRYSLLDIQVPRQVESTLPIVDQDRLPDRHYRLWLAKQLRKPIPASHWTAKIPLDRSQLNDREHRVKISSILGYAWYKRLQFDKVAPETHLTLAQMNAQILAECLRHSPRYSSAVAVSQHIMNKFAQEEIEKLLGDKLEAAFIEVEENAIASLNERIDVSTADAHRRLAEISVRTQQRFADLDRKIREGGVTTLSGKR